MLSRDTASPWPASRLFFCLRRKIQSAIPAKKARAPTATPTPMPALAPVDRPCCGNSEEVEFDVAVEVGVIEVEVGVIEEDGIVGGGAPGVKGSVCKLARSEACQRTCIA